VTSAITFDELQQKEMILSYAPTEGASSYFSCHLLNVDITSSAFMKSTLPTGVISGSLAERA
jgi:hypothetical protein